MSNRTVPTDTFASFPVVFGGMLQLSPVPTEFCLIFLLFFGGIKQLPPLPTEFWLFFKENVGGNFRYWLSPAESQSKDKSDDIKSLE